jgi:hypothetical protein
MLLLVLFLYIVKTKELQCFVPIRLATGLSYGVGLRSDYKKLRFGQIQSLYATYEQKCC